MKNTLEFRTIQKEDYTELEHIISDVWKYEDFCSPETAKKMAKLYLASCLINQTYNCVAVQDGKAVGVIMGNCFREKKHTAKYLPRRTSAVLEMALSGEGRGIMKMFQGFDQIDEELLRLSGKTYDGALEFFAVDKAVHGTGIGGQLYQRAMDYFAECQMRNFYLYTDTACNWGFYEHQGMVRVVEREKKFDGHERKIIFFLYEKTEV